MGFFSGFDERFEVLHQCTAKAKKYSCTDGHILLYFFKTKDQNIPFSLFFLSCFYKNCQMFGDVYFVKLWITLQRPPCSCLLVLLLAYNLDHGRKAIKMIT